MPEEPQNTDPQQQPTVEGTPGQWNAPKTDQAPMLESEPAPELLPEHEDTGMSSQQSVDAPKPESEPMPQTVVSTPVADPAKPKNNMMMIGIIIGAIVIAAGILVYFFMFAKK